MKIKYNPKLKQLARELRNNSTKAEIRLWKCLKNKQIKDYDFHRQKPIDEYIVDFFCHKLRLVIEVDGITHGFNNVLEKDKIKETKLQSLGLNVIRFQDSDIMDNLNGVILRLYEYIVEFEKRHTP